MPAAAIKRQSAKQNIQKTFWFAAVQPMKYETFCGGVFETNCYLFHAPKGPILFDAPDGSCAWLETRGIGLKLLLLTLGHIDHSGGVGSIKQRFTFHVG